MQGFRHLVLRRIEPQFARAQAPAELRRPVKRRREKFGAVSEGHRCCNTDGLLTTTARGVANHGYQGS